MLFDRQYKPTDDEVLYHYCSPETLLAICSYKTLRFCDLYSMNDFMEMHWGYQMFQQAIDEMRDTFDASLLEDIDSIVNTSKLRATPLASCLSTKGDVLSQWRAYAQDGAGYAVGFKASTLARMAVRPLQVSYNMEEQKAEIKKFMAMIRHVEDGESEKRSAGFFDACAALAFDLAGFKNPSFAEEGEVRLVHLLNFEPSNNSLKLSDAGGHAFNMPLSPQKIGFHMSRSVPVPHLDLDFSNGGSEHAIVEVILGPKNSALETAVSVFLETLGIPNVKVSKSKSSYR